MVIAAPVAATAVLAACIVLQRLATVRGSVPATAPSFHSCNGALCWWSVSSAKAMTQPQPSARLQVDYSTAYQVARACLQEPPGSLAVAVRTPNQVASHLKGRS